MAWPSRRRRATESCRVDVIFNNADVEPVSPMNALTTDEWDRIIDTASRQCCPSSDPPNYRCRESAAALRPTADFQRSRALFAAKPLIQIARRNAEGESTFIKVTRNDSGSIFLVLDSHTPLIVHESGSREQGWR